ncbi:MAG: mechanosensitive ion channel family protein [Candidatus Aminicenantes bacterium]|nr:mechanosensitive ion channel family protein [Candidatus Aminicenantes bacterium]
MEVIKEVYQFVVENKYLRFLVITLISFLVAYIVKVIFKKVLKPLALKTKTKVDDLIIKSLASIIFYIVLVLGVRIGIQHFDFNKAILENIIDTLLILIICLFLIRIIRDFSQHWLSEWKYMTKSSVDERVIPLLQKILKAIVFILGLFFVFSAWNINLTPLLATAGIAGLAIGLAIKDSLNNIVGGIQLVLDKTFKVGDKVEIEGVQPGVILDIGLRSTKLKTYDNEVIFIPNGILANSKIKNFTEPDLSIRVNVQFGVEYGSDLKKVSNIILDAIQNIEGVLEEPAPAVQFLNMSDFSLDFVARVWVREYSGAYSMKLKVTDEIYKTLSKEGIGIPFPTQTIYTKGIDK